MDRDKIFEKVKDILVDALVVEPEEVKLDATLMGDLGAESIDFLDIVFRLEKAFDIKIPREDLFPAENLLNNPEFVNEGRLTPKGLDELSKRLPHIDLTEFRKDPNLSKITDVFTVEAIVNYIENTLK